MTESNLPKTHTAQFQLTADNCDACGKISPSGLTRDIITTAVQHADLLDIGYRRLISEGQMWVLSRLAIEMEEWPRMFNTMELTTWIEQLNRFFSLRNFVISHNGRIAGYARTMWAAINMESRRRGDLSQAITGLEDIALDSPCPIPPIAKLHDSNEYSDSYTHTIRVSDLDFNRHLTTYRYIDLMVNAVPLSLYDTMVLKRLDIHFIHETTYGKKAVVEWNITATPEGSRIYDCRLVSHSVDGKETPLIFSLCRMEFQPII
ncbi:MAG: hypothetical protein K2M05_09085 [Paramuribaculum sp.]|nr:hypothetical protein [Paramuribaculum sp.]